MRTIPSITWVWGWVGLAALGWVGCSSTDGGSEGSASMYYGVGFSDPWHYDSYYYDYDVVGVPPSVPPPGQAPAPPPRPAHPVAPAPPMPRPTPMPSLPAAPRVAPRR